MKNGFIVKKKMSDGWVIEETYIPEKGLSNKYFFNNKPAPSVIMSDKLSVQFGGYSLIEKDLRSVLFWINEIENQSPLQTERYSNPEKMNLIKGLFVAAITFYAKCFTSCEGRKVKLDREFIQSTFRDTHDEIMVFRNNFSAHSGSVFIEKAKVSLVLPPNMNSKVNMNLFSELYQPDCFHLDDTEFKNLVLHLQDKVIKKRNSLGADILKNIVEPKGRPFWYSQALIPHE